MLDISATDTLDGLVARLDKLAQRLDTPVDLHREVATVVKAGVTRMLLDGRTADGANVPPIRPDSRRERGGSGPAGVPHGTSSRLVTQMRVEADSTGVKVTWPGFPEAIYPLTRNRQLGIDKITLDQVVDLVNKHYLEAT